MDTAEAYPFGSSPDFDPALTRREILVLRLAAQGLSNKQIACKISRCVKQVEHDIAEILRKLHAVNMKHAINIAWERGILRKEKR